jgi:hypothetical protein
VRAADLLEQLGQSERAVEIFRTSSRRTPREEQE